MVPITKHSKGINMKVKRLRWWIIGLVCLGTIVNYLSRSSLSVAAPNVMQELNFTEHEYSWIVRLPHSSFATQSLSQSPDIYSTLSV